ncbi:MAG: xylulokinase [Nitrososphaeria archaeon]
MSYLLGVDVGTSSTKSEIFSLDGKSIASSQEEYPILSPAIGMVEEDAEAWWSALKATVKEAVKRSRINPKDIAGVCVSGTNACVPVDKDGTPLTKAIMQLDNRSAGFAERIRHVVGEETVFKITGNRIAPGTFMAPTILWIKENRPEVFNQVYKFMVPTGFATMKLTGNYTIDWSRCSTTLLYDMARGKRWSDQLCSLLNIPLDKLPEPHISTDVVGEITAEAAEATELSKGTPVVAGCMDTVGAAVGSAILEPGDTFYTLGTLGRLCYCLDQPRFDMRFINICHAIEDRWLAMGLMHGGGLTLRWFRDELGTLEVAEAKKLGRSPYEIFDAEACEVPPGSRGVMFLPYLSGERSPIWDPNARGVFFGFTAQHKRSDLIRAIEEGVAYSLRHNLEVFEEMGFKINVVRMGGGGAKSALWRQIVADVIGKPVEVTKNLVTETLGDALIAGLGVKVYRSPDELKRLAEIEHVVKPDLKNHVVYSKMFNLYKRLYLHLREDFLESSKATA